MPEDGCWLPHIVLWPGLVYKKKPNLYSVTYRITNNNMLLIQIKAAIKLENIRLCSATCSQMLHCLAYKDSNVHNTAAFQKQSKIIFLRNKYTLQMEFIRHTICRLLISIAKYSNLSASYYRKVNSNWILPAL